MVSSKPTKQRKFIYNTPNHLRKLKLVAPLSKDLVKEVGVKRLPVRKGDTVKVTRGDHVGFEGKVAGVDTKSGRIAIEGLTRKKADGSPIYVWIHASKVQITKLDLSDPKRKEMIERKSKAKAQGE
ncbi:MAG: 50S ribosomal protein L24P [Candidatus Aramenus sulfurataquae]|jgi:large subunit ribosomal protein L24|uniref:Large ribosomal subunit protein uL24 n=2 Tax=Candidatus Aramenus sulfurataquae TaxID=1326980 RepID=W7KJ13_9CREN|nr:MAG: 50S ribosomal protein L24P [Candidatus Aramenus sulfurataquae]MCL7343306.1 50S ribosomal protein L24 [Candidatus Aramenus sulfurataquae]